MQFVVLNIFNIRHMPRMKENIKIQTKDNGMAQKIDL